MRIQWNAMLTIVLACGTSNEGVDGVGDQQYCSTEDRSTTCPTGQLFVACYNGAELDTTGTCSHLLTITFPPSADLEGYVEDIYCCAGE